MVMGEGDNKIDFCFFLIREYDTIPSLCFRGKVPKDYFNYVNRSKDATVDYMQTEIIEK